MVVHWAIWRRSPGNGKIDMETCDIAQAFRRARELAIKHAASPDHEEIPRPPALQMMHSSGIM